MTLPKNIAAAIESKPAIGIRTLANAGKILNKTLLSEWEKKQTGDIEVDEDPYQDGYALYWDAPDEPQHETMHPGPVYLFDEVEEAQQAAAALVKFHERAVVICYEEWDFATPTCLDSEVFDVVEVPG